MGEPRFKVGDKVQSKSDRTRVGIVEGIGLRSQGRQYYKVFWGGRDGTMNVPEYDLDHHRSAEKPSDNLAEQRLAGYAEFQRLITYHRLLRDFPLRNNIYAFNASRTRLLPYQFKPLVKLLDSPRHRLLVCDEVGLGKTIEAGLILTELRARQIVDRVMVVVPANLRWKWKDELKKRFDEDFRILRSVDFTELLDEVEKYGDRVKFNGIVSLETLRSESILDRIKEVDPRFDVVVVDEAHHMRNFGTSSRLVGVRLRDAADVMIMLTATPVHLGDENLFSLLNILDEEDFSDLETARARFRANEPIVRAQICMGQVPPNVGEALSSLLRAGRSQWLSANPQYAELCRKVKSYVNVAEDEQTSRSLHLEIQRDMSEVNLLSHILTRTKRKDVQEGFATRHAHSIVVELSAEERDFYNTVTALVRRESEEHGYNALIQQWLINMPQRRIASSIPAMVEHYQSEYGIVVDKYPEDAGVVPEELSEEGAAAKSVSELRSRLKELCRRWPVHRTDTKYSKFLEALKRMMPDDGGTSKVIVFAFFKDTLNYLQTRLREDGFKAVLISGDIAPESRTDLIDMFRDRPDIRVLLSSRVGSEGLDFQFCDTIFNYDLPWNPMEVEQRIGRVDRIGQQSQIINIHNLWISNTIEERILRRLYERIGVFERTIGELEPILGPVIQELEKNLFSCKLTPQEEEIHAERSFRIIEQKLDDMRKLESEAARFIGTDQYFDDEIQAIRTRRMYTTGEQLKRFLEDFIRRQCPKTRLEFDPEKKVGRLYPDEQLHSFVVSNTNPGEVSDLLASRDKGVTLTFESQVAFENPKIEFVNVVHPLIQAIVKSYAADINSRIDAQHVVLRTDSLTKGFYYYFVYRLRMTSANPRNTLEVVIVDDENLEVCEHERSEIVFGEMVEKGEEAGGLPISINADRARAAARKAEQHFLSQVERLKSERDRTNDAFLNRRLASLGSFYGKKIEARRQRLDSAKWRGVSEFSIRMEEAKLKRDEQEYDRKRADLEKLRTVAEEYVEIAAGVLEVG
jgi:superfamily II DNA or RNA helicase